MKNFTGRIIKTEYLDNNVYVAFVLTTLSSNRTLAKYMISHRDMVTVGDSEFNFTLGTGTNGEQQREKINGEWYNIVLPMLMIRL
jgi:hypothetical protein